MLARAVDARERLLVQQADEAVFFGGVAQHFHYHHVVVVGEVELFEHGGYFKLRGRDFVVARFRRNAEPPKLVVHVGHEVEYARLYGAEIVVFKLLVLLRGRTEKRASGLH